MTTELLDELQALLDAGKFATLSREMLAVAPALLSAAREVVKLQELRKKWGGDTFGHLQLAEAFDAFCELQSTENLRLREALEELVDWLDGNERYISGEFLMDDLLKGPRKALGKEAP